MTRSKSLLSCPRLPGANAFARCKDLLGCTRHRYHSCINPLLVEFEPDELKVVYDKRYQCAQIVTFTISLCLVCIAWNYFLLHPFPQESKPTWYSYVEKAAAAWVREYWVLRWLITHGWTTLWVCVALYSTAPPDPIYPTNGGGSSQCDNIKKALSKIVESAKKLHDLLSSNTPPKGNWVGSTNAPDDVKAAVLASRSMSFYCVTDIPFWRWELQASIAELPLLRDVKSEEFSIAKFFLRLSLGTCILGLYLEINSIFIFLKNEQMIFAIVQGIMVLTLMLHVGLPSRQLVETIHSAQQGLVHTKAYHEVKAYTGNLSGAWGVINQASYLFDNSVAEITRYNLEKTLGMMFIVLALLNSLYSVYSSVGESQELAGAMAKQLRMPHSAQSRVPLYCGRRMIEVLCLLPVLHAATRLGLLQIYAMCTVALAIIYTAIFMMTSLPLLPLAFVCPTSCGCYGAKLLNYSQRLMAIRPWSDLKARFAFQRMNPAAFGLLSLWIEVVLWPLIPLWNGCFTDTAGHAARRHVLMQWIFPVPTQLMFYTGRLVQAIMSIGMIMTCHHCEEFDQKSIMPQILFIIGILAVCGLMWCLKDSLIEYVRTGHGLEDMMVLDTDSAILARAELMLKSPCWCYPWTQAKRSAQRSACRTVMGFAHLRKRESKKALACWEEAWQKKKLDDVEIDDDMRANFGFMMSKLAYGRALCPQKNRKDEGIRLVQSLEDWTRRNYMLQGIASMALGIAYRSNIAGKKDIKDKKYWYNKSNEQCEKAVQQFDLANAQSEQGWAQGNKVRGHLQAVYETIFDGDHSSVIAEGRQTVELLRAAHGKEHGEVGWGKAAYGKAIIAAAALKDPKDAQDEYREAEKFLLNALQLTEADYGPAHDEVARVMADLIEVKVALRKLPEAKDLIELAKPYVIAHTKRLEGTETLLKKFEDQIDGTGYKPIRREEDISRFQMLMSAIGNYLPWRSSR